MRWLVDGYGSDTRITNIVNGREIWIIFLVNPDGAEYDIANGRFHYWRKNRQPTPGTGYTGTDLNRNYGYRWGGGGRTSSNPAAITYRGPAAWSAPRSALCAISSRAASSTARQIRMHITFHEAGRLVMWPYGYTYADLPGDMTSADHHAFVHMGRQMAATNGYKPEQASDLYITSGTTRDYAYGVYRIFSYTFEMSNRDYMDDSLIASETGRNKAAVLYLAERAWCPHAVLGTSYVHWRCGLFDDDFEAARGWTTNPDGTDTATSGAFARGNPDPRRRAAPKQLGTVPSGSRAVATGLLAGSSANANDLDGSTTVRSAPIRLFNTTGQQLYFRYVLPTARIRRRPTGSSRASRRRAGPGRRSSRRPGPRRTSTASGGASTSRSTPGRARRSASSSRRSTARRTAWSRSSSRTCASREAPSDLDLAEDKLLSR